MAWETKTVKEILMESYGEEASKEILFEMNSIISEGKEETVKAKMEELFQKHNKSLSAETLGTGSAIGTATGTIMGEAIGVK